ncbi:SUKH-3 domain-containing protein, partial [Tenacibaculum maritimum]
MGTIKNQLNKKSLNFLKKNSLIIENLDELIDNNSFNKSLKLYEEAQYKLTESVVEFLKYFANKKIRFKTRRGKDEIHFKTKRVLNVTNLKDWENTYRMKGTIPLGLVYSEYMTFFCDEKGLTYASFDYTVIFLGNSPIEGLNNILNDNILKKIDFDNRDRSLDKNTSFRVNFEKSDYKGKLYSFLTELGEIEVKSKNTSFKGESFFSIGGQILILLNENYIIENINFGLDLSHYDIVDDFPPIFIEEDNVFYNLKVIKEDIYDALSLNYTSEKRT